MSEDEEEENPHVAWYLSQIENDPIANWPTARKLFPTCLGPGCHMGYPTGHPII